LAYNRFQSNTLVSGVGAITGGALIDGFGLASVK
jgi:hypothetical protein